MRDASYTIESRGFLFATKAMIGIFAFGAIVQFGVTAAADEFFAKKERPTQVAAISAVSAPEPERATPSLKEIPLPDVSASAFLVGDIGEGTVYASRNADFSLPIASITKLMTALVADTTLPKDTRVTITNADRANSEGTPGSLPASTTFLAQDLLYPLLEESNNAVAFALARAGGDVFIETMNARASEFGMTTTHFEEPTGLSPKNVSSARDLFLLTKYAYDVRPDLLKITKEQNKTVTSVAGRSYKVPNFNVFGKDVAFVGGKTGFTDEANQTMTTIFEVPRGTSTTTIAIIVLGSEDRKKDIEALRQWFARSVSE